MTTTDPTILIDCNDSFTYNIQQLLVRSGVEDLLIIPVSELEPGKISSARRIILSPGPGIPEEYPRIFEMLSYLTKNAIRTPVLGICLGHQIICRFFGGRLYNLDRVIHGQPHRIKILKDDYLFRGLPHRITVGLYHSWAVENTLPPSMEVTAESESGVIMAVKHRELPYRGLQFHPESFITEYGKELIQNFIGPLPS